MEQAQKMTTFEQTVESLCDRIQYVLDQLAACPQQRIMIALAGVPGSGKSTVCAAVSNSLSCRGIEDVSVVPMDGFHYPKAVLSTFGDPVLAFQKRGAPFTFDGTAFLKLVSTLNTMPVIIAAEPEILVHCPSFDHAKQDPIAGDIKISSRHRIVIVEGNYTLLGESPWNAISEIVHVSWFVDALPEIAKQRLVERHIKAGIELSRVSATRRMEDNDIPNGEFIMSRLIRPNVTIQN